MSATKIASAVMRLIAAAFQHRHRWRGTGWNAWSVEIEQRCRCGEYRYHTWEDIKDGKPVWRSGRHPSIQRGLRNNLP